jgi:hypothetical protein
VQPGPQVIQIGLLDRDRERAHLGSRVGHATTVVLMRPPTETTLLPANPFQVLSGRWLAATPKLR